MPPEHPRTFGGGAAATSLNPFVLVALLLAVLLVLWLPRRYVILPMLVLALLVPVGQVIVLGPVHLFVSRVVVLVALSRVLTMKFVSRHQLLVGGYNSIDSAFFWCAIFQAVASVLLFRDGLVVINQFGTLVDYLGAYVVLRSLIRDEEDVNRTLKCLAFLVMILSLCMCIEQVKVINVFSAIGGRATPEIRDGAVRAQGPFSHPLTAGAFAASSLALFLLLWSTGRRSKFLGAAGVVGATIMTIASHSSTPLLAYLGGLLAVCLWPMRAYMRALRWGLVCALLGLAVVMKAPVWFIIARIDLTGSSSSYHRALVIDQFIRHFSDWWLIGVKASGSWGWDLWDAQNQFVSVGLNGGLVVFILFITMVVRCFVRLGAARRAAADDREQQWRAWCVGSALFATVVAFFGVNYFDQCRLVWLALLAMTTAVTGPTLRTTERVLPEPDLACNLHA